MKTFWKAFAIGITAASAAIVASGYGFIFKAIGKNIPKGPLTPSIDDAEKFPFNPVPSAEPVYWETAEHYNTLKLPDVVLENLKDTKASALLVAKNGKLIHEEYWCNHGASSLMNSFSMAKGILSLLVGIAVDEGKIRDENQFFSDFFPEYADMEFGKELTLKHLMTMQAGLDWPEEYHHPFAPNSKQYFVDDLGEQVFGRKFCYAPGTQYEYQSAAPQLLGFALKKAVGMPLASYLSEKIWKPMGMEYPAKWSVDAQGIEKAFCCIHASARDFLKIGQMVLEGGFFNGKQIVSKNFIDRALKPTKENDAFGYTIWANKDCRIPHRFFYGFLGQFIIIIPEKRMAIVKFGHDNHLPVDGKLRPLQVNFLVEQLSEFF